MHGGTLSDIVMGKDKKNSMESKKQKKQRIGKTRR